MALGAQPSQAESGAKRPFFDLSV